MHNLELWKFKDIKKRGTLIDTQSCIRPVSISYRGRRGRDLVVVGFTTTYAISAYHHCRCEFESQSGWGIQHYVIKFVSDLRQVNGFLRVLQFPPQTNKNYRHDITEILSKVVLSTTALATHYYWCFFRWFSVEWMAPLIFTEIGNIMRMVLETWKGNFGWVSVIKWTAYKIPRCRNSSKIQ